MLLTGFLKFGALLRPVNIPTKQGTINAATVRNEKDSWGHIFCFNVLNDNPVIPLELSDAVIIPMKTLL